MDDTAETTENENDKEEDLKYDPDGNRIFKDSSEVEKRKYIVDIVGDLPVILMELDSARSLTLLRTYMKSLKKFMGNHIHHE